MHTQTSFAEKHYCDPLTLQHRCCTLGLDFCECFRNSRGFFQRCFVIVTCFAHGSRIEAAWIRGVRLRKRAWLLRGSFVFNCWRAVTNGVLSVLIGLLSMLLWHLQCILPPPHDQSVFVRLRCLLLLRFHLLLPRLLHPPPPPLHHQLYHLMIIQHERLLAA